MIISDEQIKQIANSIVFDVHQYIKEHQEEYEKFLAEEISKSTEQGSENSERKIKLYEKD